ncbi:MAG TPA: hypothetical protein VE733_04705 [Streptosporangiaceae bacterium]|nr:hypothetical protein [Streptosporangiaceae bacterium]
MRTRLFAWLVTVAGLAASVAANVGHVAGHDLASRATAAVPPLAAAASLTVALGLLKRTVGAHQPAAEAAPENVVEDVPVEVPTTVPATTAETVADNVLEEAPIPAPASTGQAVAPRTDPPCPGSVPGQ